MSDADRREPLDPGRDADSLRRHPLPFKCRIIPRALGMDAEKLEQLIDAITA